MEMFRGVQKLSHLYKEEELMMKKLISLRTQKNNNVYTSY